MDVQSDQGICCLLTESLDTTECINGKHRLGEIAHADLNLHILHRFRDTFLHGAPTIMMQCTGKQSCDVLQEGQNIFLWINPYGSVCSLVCQNKTYG